MRRSSSSPTCAMCISSKTRRAGSFSRNTREAVSSQFRHGVSRSSKGGPMSISYEDVASDLRRIVISGRLDMPGTDSVASQLAQLTAAPKKAVVVDLSPLKVLASIGIRALISSAKDVQKRGGKMALVVNKGSTVMMSLEATGVDELIPVFGSFRDAEKAVLA